MENATAKRALLRGAVLVAIVITLWMLGLVRNSTPVVY